MVYSIAPDSSSFFTSCATVDRFNGWSKEGVDRDFHRGETVWERFYTKDRALGTVEQGLLAHLRNNDSALLEEIRTKDQAIKGEIETKIKSAIDAFAKTFA